MRFAFLGTPEFAKTHLAALLAAGYRPDLVISQPDKRAGRKKGVQPSPVKEMALENGLRVETPERIRQTSLIDRYIGENFDLAIVVAYGQILAPRFIEAPRLGTINVHGSLLPRWRGAAPIQRALMAGDEHTGCTIQQMAHQLDAGPVLASSSFPINPEDTSESLFVSLAGVGAKLLADSLPSILSQERKGEPQDTNEVRYAEKLTKEEGVIDWKKPGRELFNHIRGVQPWPGAWTTLTMHNNSKRVKLVSVETGPDVNGAPGEILSLAPDFVVGTGDETSLCIRKIQPEAKQAMAAPQFIAGYQPKVGDFFV